MHVLVLLLMMALPALAQEQEEEPRFDIRARSNLLFGKGERTGSEYYDVVITRRPKEGVLIKLPYTKKGGKFSFDLHHRIAMSEDFGLPAEVTTVVEAMTGGTNRIGVFAISDKINPEDHFDEAIHKVSTAEIDRFVTPMARKTITIDTQPGPQSISIVGQVLMITRGKATTRIDTPGTRIATVSNFKFEPAGEINPLKKSPE